MNSLCSDWMRGPDRPHIDRRMSGGSWLVAVWLYAIASAIATPPPTVLGDSPAWPLQFQILFQSGVNSTGSGQPVLGAMYYDWTKQVQAVVHGAGGAYECVRFYNTSDECVLQFNQNGVCLWAVMG